MALAAVDNRAYAYYNNNQQQTQVEDSSSTNAAQTSNHVGYTWVKIYLDTLFSDQLSDGAKILLFTIQHYQGKKPYAFPSEETLAKKINKSVRRVQVLIKELEAKGFLTIAKQPGWVNLYSVNQAKGAASEVLADTTNQTQLSEAQPATDTAPVGRKGAMKTSPLPPMNPSPELESFKQESMYVCKATANFTRNEQLRAGNQNNQPQQQPKLKVIDSQKSNYQHQSPIVGMVLTVEQQEIADILAFAGVAEKVARNIALTDPPREAVEQWISFARDKANPGGYLAKVLSDGKVPPPNVVSVPKPTNNSQPHHSYKQPGDEQHRFTGPNANKGGTIDFTKYAPGGKYGNVVSVVAAVNTEPTLETEAQATLEISVFGEVATVVATESNVEIDVPQPNQPCETLADNYGHNPNGPIPGQIGEWSLDALVPYRVKPVVADTASPVHQTEIVAPVAVLDGPIVPAPASVITPQALESTSTKSSDPRRTRALQLLEGDAAFVADTAIENNNRGEPTLTITFLAGQKLEAITLEQWKHALHFHHITHNIKNIAVREARPEPQRNEVTNFTSYSCNFQKKESCEQTATPVIVANNESDCEAWKAPAIAKCLELLSDDAGLVKDICIGLNWIGQLAVMVAFNADNQPANERLVWWKREILCGYNRELRGKGIKEVEVTLLKPSSFFANTDTEELVSGGQEILKKSDSADEVAVADNYPNSGFQRPFLAYFSLLWP